VKEFIAVLREKGRWKMQRKESQDLVVMQEGNKAFYNGNCDLR